ncbi:hypothetical protein DEU56DRAFT_200533 [Suillus clintonianus]|uniref:uncharacterized protein n=1 Tax=Suillus clintonianus TaxID=1904413 RepID=UPI001B8815D3|nr:uncharacterized protein DEU56DRAFT_200533 [Suillus clintonianus]KAG2112513.1 hypothetical protein DEU56DRAFT_200533 [Suillus clintonianus]
MSFQRPILGDPWEKLSQVAVLGAEYDSPERQPHPRLLEGSWVDLNNCILELLDNQTKNQLIWLHGAMGVGTSAISFNVAEGMKSLQVTAETKLEVRLGGTFFFSRGHAKRSMNGFFFATLAYQLARNFPSVRTVVNEAIRNHPALLDPGASLRDQMEALFLRPLRALQFRLRNCPPIVFIVDALHECTSKHEVADLISLLCQVLRRPDLPRFHIQFTSGSQAHIREAFQKEEMRPLLCEIRGGSSGELLAINMASRDACIPGDLPHILDINTTTYNACINGDLPAAEGLLTQEIDTDINSHRAYANRAFVMARKYDWDHALEDALKV